MEHTSFPRKIPAEYSRRKSYLTGTRRRLPPPLRRACGARVPHESFSLSYGELFSRRRLHGRDAHARTKAHVGGSLGLIVGLRQWVIGLGLAHSSLTIPVGVAAVLRPIVFRALVAMLLINRAVLVVLPDSPRGVRLCLAVTAGALLQDRQRLLRRYFACLSRTFLQVPFRLWTFACTRPAWASLRRRAPARARLRRLLG